VTLKKWERNLLKLNADLGVTETKSIPKLRKIFHDKTNKVNSWIKQSLNGSYQKDFDYFMTQDNTHIDLDSSALLKNK
jgi:hypothetical protein